ncbi:Berberine bridge enzyme-like 17 [Camellia lanceoleosa]|uniref:Berberine bridge enzyme-like 17 n=1 Tax=Camellia lanceoleosa TaxID=1840588 RepID=A0ACC0GLJ9_9ERIC|nr:Berberine bridge enzyme-like 17 [Camellia lanceoleosa]
MGEDHFWAIRGGGASFGVILSWKIKLVSVPEVVTFFLVKKLIKQGATTSITDLVYRWQQVVDTLPQDIFIRLEMSVEKNESIQFQFFGQYLGQSYTLLSIMNQQFPELGLQQKDCIESSWIETTLYWDNKPKGTSLGSLLYRMVNQSFPFKVKSDYVITPIPKAVLEELWKKMIKMGIGMIMQWNPYGGRMNQISESETPFPHRSGYKFLIQYWYYTQDNSKVESLRKLYDFMAPHVSQSPREAFLNYRDLDIGTNQNGANSSIFGAKYFKGNFERLVRVKTKVDPDNFFRNEQSIPPLPK